MCMLCVSGTKISKNRMKNVGFGTRKPKKPTFLQRFFDILVSKLTKYQKNRMKNVCFGFQKPKKPTFL